jgi:adenylate cyclase
MLAFWTTRPAEDEHPANRAVSGIIRFLRKKWDAPAPDSNHAVRAVRAAFAIVERVELAREADEARNERGFTIKVGINSGPASIGNVGAGKHFSYSLQGKAVNFASRLESVPPLYGCFIVVGEDTAQLVRDKFLMRELDRILVKGAEAPMTIYQPIADLAQANDAQKALVASFSLALEHYRAARLTEACSIWDDLVVKYEPAPSPSSVMAARAREYMTSPPAPPWPTHELKSK